MAARNALLEAVPYQVERSLKKLGADLKTARLRRNLTIEEVAQKIGTGRFVVADAEMYPCGVSFWWVGTHLR